MPNMVLPAEKYFLATTALEEFWNKDGPVRFLGDWCIRYEKSSSSTANRLQVLDSPWATPGSIEQGYRFATAVYERMLKTLSERLNEIHGIGQSQRFWRIVVGPWLLFYTQAIFDRYRYVCHAIERYPNFFTYVLRTNDHHVPADTLESVELLKTDDYNLRVFSRILKLMESGSANRFECIEVESGEMQSGHQDVGSRSGRGRGLFEFLVSTLYEAYRSISIGRAKIVLRNSYFPLWAVAKLIFLTRGKVFVCQGDEEHASGYRIDEKMRSILVKGSDPGDEFSGILLKMIPVDMPRCFLERFGDIRKSALRSYPGSPKAIFSANSWYFDEGFKQWAAIHGDKGVALLGTQHGGNYGCARCMPSEDHETSICDVYYTWGWTRKDVSATVIPKPATKFAGRKNLVVSGADRGILYVATVISRYLIEFPPLNVHFNDYLGWQLTFLNRLAPSIVSELRFRPHREDLGWGVAQRVKARMPKVRAEDWNTPFLESLRNCRLFVCDHHTTTCVEALAADKPTILFWDPRVNLVRLEAQPLFDGLRRVGVLHDSPEGAAEAVNSAYDRVEAWWAEEQRREAVRNFRDRFGMSSPDAVSEWACEFGRIAKSPSGLV